MKTSNERDVFFEVKRKYQATAHKRMPPPSYKREKC
jgi:hypothetical protein